MNEATTPTTPTIRLERHSVDMLHVEVPQDLREAFEDEMLSVTTHPMRLKDGIDVPFHLFNDADFEDERLNRFKSDVLAATEGTAFEPDGYLFVERISEPELIEKLKPE